MSEPMCLRLTIRNEEFPAYDDRMHCPKCDNSPRGSDLWKNEEWYVSDDGNCKHEAFLLNCRYACFDRFDLGMTDHDPRQMLFHQ